MGSGLVVGLASRLINIGGSGVSAFVGVLVGLAADSTGPAGLWDAWRVNRTEEHIGLPQPSPYPAYLAPVSGTFRNIRVRLRAR